MIHSSTLLLIQMSLIVNDNDKCTANTKIRLQQYKTGLIKFFELTESYLIQNQIDIIIIDNTIDEVSKLQTIIDDLSKFSFNLVLIKDAEKIQ